MFYKKNDYSYRLEDLVAPAPPSPPDFNVGLTVCLQSCFSTLKSGGKGGLRSCVFFVPRGPPSEQLWETFFAAILVEVCNELEATLFLFGVGMQGELLVAGAWRAPNLVARMFEVEGPVRRGRPPSRRSADNSRPAKQSSNQPQAKMCWAQVWQGEEGVRKDLVLWCRGG